MGAADRVETDPAAGRRIEVAYPVVLHGRVAGTHLTVCVVEDVCQALYREAQLALRAVVGARELDTSLRTKTPSLAS